MSLLALDLGSITGWAIDGEPMVSGTFDLRPRRFEGGGMRFLRFDRSLNEIYAWRTVTEVVFEEVRRHMGVDAAHVYGGLLGALQKWCEEREIPYSGIPVGTIKKFIAGKGNASKHEVVAAVCALGHEVQDDNHADAIAILLCHKAAIDGGR